MTVGLLKNASLIKQPDNYADKNEYHHGGEESLLQPFMACLYKAHASSPMSLGNERLFQLISNRCRSFLATTFAGHI